MSKPVKNLREDIIQLDDQWGNTLIPISQLDKVPEGPYDPSVILCTLEGKLSDFSESTRNGRWYTREVWNTILNSVIFQELVETRTLFGESDHPMDIEDRVDIHYNYVSHAVRDVTIDDNEQCVRGKLDILDTPSGRIIFTFVKYGSILGVSSRGAGDLLAIDTDGNSCRIGTNKKGQQVKMDEFGHEAFIQQTDRIEVDPETYEFYGWDIVHRPSNRKARVNLKEGMQPSTRLFGLVESAKSDRKSLLWVKSLVESTNVHDKENVVSKLNEYIDMLSGDDGCCKGGCQCKNPDTSVTQNYEEIIAGLKSDIIELTNQIVTLQSETPAPVVIEPTVLKESIDTDTMIASIADAVIQRLPNDDNKKFDILFNRKLSEFGYKLEKKLVADIEPSITQIPDVRPELASLKQMIEQSGAIIVDNLGGIFNESLTNMSKKLSEGTKNDKLVRKLEEELSTAKSQVEILAEENEQLLNEKSKSSSIGSGNRLAENERYLKARCKNMNLNEREVVNQLPHSLSECDFDDIDTTVKECYSESGNSNISESERVPAQSLGRIKLNENTGTGSDFSLVDLVRGNN